MQTYRPSDRDPLTGSFSIPLSQIDSFDSSRNLNFIDPQVLFATRNLAKFTSRDSRLFLLKSAIPEIDEMVMAPSLSTPSVCDHRLGLNASASRNSPLREFQPSSSRTLVSRIPETRKVSGVLTPSNM
jgi:hypothetical protein